MDTNRMIHCFQNISISSCETSQKDPYNYISKVTLIYHTYFRHYFHSWQPRVCCTLPDLRKLGIDEYQRVGYLVNLYSWPTKSFVKRLCKLIQTEYEQATQYGTTHGEQAYHMCLLAIEIYGSLLYSNDQNNKHRNYSVSMKRVGFFTASCCL